MRRVALGWAAMALVVVGCGGRTGEIGTQDGGGGGGPDTGSVIGRDGGGPGGIDGGNGPGDGGNPSTDSGVVLVGTDGGNTPPPSGLPASCTDNPNSMVNEACASCVESGCPAAFSTFLTACDNYLSCVCGCPTGNSACLSGCAIPDGCEMTLQPLETCETAHCMAECGTTTSSGDAGAPAADGGASCTSLAACCAMLTSAEQSGCTDVVAAGQATDCQEALSAYMSANLCH